MFLSKVAEWKPDSLQTSKNKGQKRWKALKFLDGRETRLYSAEASMRAA